jgi:uncharacterized protein (TIGR03435 family)
MTLVVALACALLHAQAKPQFEVASVKPAVPQSNQAHGPVSHGPVYGGPGTPSPGQITYTNQSLQFLIAYAYDVRLNQLSAPSWMDEERFDIVAKVPAGAVKSEIPLMLQSLLGDRFQLKVRHESKEMQAYALTVG